MKIDNSNNPLLQHGSIMIIIYIFTLIKLKIRYVLALHSRKIYLLTGRHIFSIPNGGSLPRRHPLGSSRNLRRKGRLHDEPKECLRRRLEPIRMGSNMVARKQQKHLVSVTEFSFATKACIYLSRNSRTLK